MKKLILLVLLFTCQVAVAQNCALSFNYENLTIDDKSTRGWDGDAELRENAEREFVKQYNKTKPKFKLDTASPNKLVVKIESIKTGSFMVAAVTRMDVTVTVGGKEHTFEIVGRSSNTWATATTPNLRVMSSFGYAAEKVSRELNRIKK